MKTALELANSTREFKVFYLTDTSFNKLVKVEAIQFSSYEEWLEYAVLFLLKEKRLLEDSNLVHRIVNAQERRVFKTEVGNLNKDEQSEFLNDTLSEIKRAV